MADIRDDRWEWFHYDNPDFPVQFRKNYIPANVEFEAMTKHWHDDIEFIYVEEGKIYYEMENENIIMQEGEGIFVNTKQLHLIHSMDSDCVLYCLIFHPIILCSSEHITSNYVAPLLKQPKFPYLKLTEEILWQKQILMDIKEMHLYSEDPQGHLILMSYIYHIWNNLYQNLIKTDELEKENPELAILKKMVTFIQNNYRHKITVSEICHAGNVGKTKCSALFDAHYNMSPMEFVRNYRIEKGAKLLEISDMSITEIAYEIGMSDGSHFSKIFGQRIGCTPQQYRSFGRGMSTFYELRRFPHFWSGIQDTDYPKSDL